MPPVELPFPLAPRERDLRSVLDDDDVAREGSVWRKRGLVFPLKDAGELGSEASDDLVFRVDEAEADLFGGRRSRRRERDALLVVLRFAFFFFFWKEKKG